MFRIRRENQCRASETRISTACSRSVEVLEARLMLAAHIIGSSTVYPTIQAAVDAATSGATITVDPGNYAELVTVNKSLTIEGAQAGVDARTNTRAAAVAAGDESIITGASGTNGVSTSFYIAANDVTIDGFTIQGNTNQNNYGAGIVMAPNIAGAHIINDIIQNNLTGVMLSNDSASDPVLIQHDYFLNNNGPGANSSRGIYSDGGVSGGLLTNVVIDSNAFITNVLHAGAARYEGCIALEGNTAGDQQNITITNNSMDGDGKLLLYNCQNVDIEHNVMTHSLDQWSGTFRFEGGDINVTVEYNTIYDNTGPGLSVDSKGFPAPDSGFVVENNNFYNNNTAYNNKYSLAVTADAYDGTFDATNNYWGAASGPSGQGTGTGDMAWGNGLYSQGGSSGWSTGAGSELVLTPYSSTPIGSLDTPYYGVAQNTGAPIQAEDYDQGGKGNGYYSTNNINAAGQYRPAEYVGIQSCTDTGGGYDVTSTVAGEWLDYTVNVTQSGNYNLEIRLAGAQTTEGQFHVDLDGNNVTGMMTAPDTGSGQAWQTVTLSGINMTAGTHVLSLVMDAVGSSGYVDNFNWIELDPNGGLTPTPPAAPTNLTATAISATTVRLAWQELSANQTGFTIQRSTDGVNFTTVGTTAATATGYSDTTAVAGTSYIYRVYATSASGNSAYSAVATATTPSIVSAPTGLTAVAISTTQVNLAWTDTAVGVETGFIIQRSTGGGNYVQIATTAAGVTSFSDTTASAATAYTYCVLAISAGGNSPASNTASATTLNIVAPAAPTPPAPAAPTPPAPAAPTPPAPAAPTLPAPAAPTLPAPWANASIGNVGQVGSASASAGVFTVAGAGAGIGGKADALDYAYQSLSGNGTIIAHLDTAQNGTNEAGIMIRESTDPGAKEVAVAVMPNKIRFVHRGKIGALAGMASTRVMAHVPQWVRLTRKKNTFTAYDSVDGIHWKKIGSATIKMNASLSIGLAAASGTTATLNSTLFSEVSVVV